VVPSNLSATQIVVESALTQAMILEHQMMDVLMIPEATTVSQAEGKVQELQQMVLLLKALFVPPAWTMSLQLGHRMLILDVHQMHHFVL
jgi:hypothetical protein